MLIFLSLLNQKFENNVKSFLCPEIAYVKFLSFNTTILHKASRTWKFILSIPKQTKYSEPEHFKVRFLFSLSSFTQMNRALSHQRQHVLLFFTWHSSVSYPILQSDLITDHCNLIGLNRGVGKDLERQRKSIPWLLLLSGLYFRKSNQSLLSCKACVEVSYCT